MSKSSTLKNNIRIIRPLLDEKKIELKAARAKLSGPPETATTNDFEFIYFSKTDLKLKYDNVFLKSKSDFFFSLRTFKSFLLILSFL